MLAIRLSWQHEYIFITEIDDASMLIYFNFALMAFQDASELYLLYTLAVVYCIFLFYLYFNIW